MTQRYYADVATAFDRAAGSYARDYASNPVMAWLGDDTFDRLCRLFPPGSRLLEIGCGTGEMALRLAEAGRAVVATDIAPGMVARAQDTAATSPARDRLVWLATPAAEIGELVAGPFAGAYSNLGALNCEPNLSEFVRSLAGLLAPGGAFLCSVMNRWCAWEIAWGLLHGRPREATRRLARRKGWAPARMSAGEGQAPSIIQVRYFTPGEFASAFRAYFRVETVLGYPVLIPPPYLAARFPGGPARLSSPERRVHAWPGFRSLGDHFLLVLRRRDDRGEHSRGLSRT